MEENAKIKDPINYYGFRTDEIGVIIQNQKLAKWDDLIIDDAEMHLYPLLEWRLRELYERGLRVCFVILIKKA